MTSREFELPPPVRLRAESLGRQGVQWLAGLSESVGYLEDKWSIRVGDVLFGGSESLVAEAVLSNGAAAIVKIGMPGSANLAMEAKVYGLAAGRGYANLIAHDVSQKCTSHGTPGCAVGRNWRLC